MEKNKTWDIDLVSHFKLNVKINLWCIYKHIVYRKYNKSFLLLMEGITLVPRVALDF